MNHLARRRSVSAALLVLGFLLGGSAVALAAGAPARVRPVISAASREAALRKGVTPRGEAMTPAEAAQLELLAARRRAFQPLQDELMRRSRGVDHSPSASRRRGWKDPAARARDFRSSALRAQGVPAVPPDTIRLALLRIDFLQDRGGGASTGDGHFDLSGPDTLIPPIDRPPHNRTFYRKHAEAMSRYYDVMSYGRVVLEVDVWPRVQNGAYSVSDMADFGPWMFSPSIFDAAVSMFRTMMFAADSQSIVLGDRIPWDSYDRFTIIHAGGDLQNDLRQDSPEDIPSFTLFVADSNRVIFPDSTTQPIDRIAFVPETNNQDGFYGAINGVLAHENGHNLFGLADVYNIDNGYPVVGYWSLMDSGNLLGSRVLLADGSEIFATGFLPPSIDAFQRFFIGDSLRFVRPADGDTIAIRRNQVSNVMAQIGLSTDEYLLIENRYQSPGAIVELDQDDTTRVFLGPMSPDRYGYDALQLGGGLLIWHVDASVIPFDTALRPNPDYGWNSNRQRLGLQLIEADGLDDLGDPGSPFILGSPLDPYVRSVNPALSDSTQPSLVTNQGTFPHMRIDVLDEADTTMRIVMRRSWSLPAWPLRGDFPPGGPIPLAIDADGDRDLEVCWAGGDTVSADSAGLFAIRVNGLGINGASRLMATLDQRPRQPLAAVLIGDPTFQEGPSLFAATTFWYGPADTVGGRVWLVDHDGAPVTGWPVRLASPASTPPVIVGTGITFAVLVGCEDGRVRALAPDGALIATSDVALAGGVRGRLAFGERPILVVPTGPGGTGAPLPIGLVAAGGGQGQIAVFELLATTTGGTLDAVRNPPTASPWPIAIGPADFEPDFLWLYFGGAGVNAEGNCSPVDPTLVVHHADRLWAYCPLAQEIPGWNRSFGDTLVAGLGGGDPDGDGFPEVLVQTIGSRIAFVNRDGRPSPGWPRAGTTEGFRTGTPPLAVDLDRDGRADVVAMNASGMVVALDGAGKRVPGFPLGTGAGAAGATLAADLDRDGRIEIVAPDRIDSLYAFSIPVPALSPIATPWTMVGGDPGRTSSLPNIRTPVTAASSAGPLERGSLKAYPNPARNRPVQFAFRLSEAAEVEARVLDTSGREVASFTRQGQRADNVLEWDPGALPAGLYVVHLRFKGARGERTANVPVGLLR